VEHAMQKFIIGWVKVKPDKCSEFHDAMKAHAVATRLEDGCVFFDVGASLEDPDKFVIVECFESAEAHEHHLNVPRMKALMTYVSDMFAEARFENILSDNVVTDGM
jgi:quinol monooxygenase YgiN